MRNYYIFLFTLLTVNTIAQSLQPEIASQQVIDRGQRWQSIWSSGGTFEEVRAAFYEDYEGIPYLQIPHYKQFKRLENLYLPRLGQDGNHHPMQTLNNYQQYQSEHTSLSRSATANWNFLGPAVVPSFINFQEGIGRVDRVSFHPSDPNTYWVSTPTQGLWKTTNNGANWAVLTDAWASLGVGDVIVDPSNTNNIYVSTGTGDVGSISPFGIMKSTDGGVTFASSGLTSVTQIHKLMIDPNNVNRLFASTNSGLYISTDGASTWALHTSLPVGTIYDMEFKPSDASTIYLILNNGGSVEFRKSVDSGTTFSSISMPYTPANISRTLIAVTPNDPNYVYVLTADISTAGMEGLYKSTDSGANFALISSPSDAVSYPNGDAHAAPTIQQVVHNNSAWGWILGVSPTDKNDIYIGAVWICRTTDGGTTWKDIGDSNHGGMGIHVDFHDIKWHPTTNLLYITSDGGIYRDNGSYPIENISNGLAIQQNYTFASTQDGVKILTGNQDNGTFYYDGSTWKHWISGDGMTCFFNPGNSTNFYGSLQGGLGIVKTTDGGISSSNMITAGEISQSAGFEVQFKNDPFYRDHLYAAYEDVWKTTDQGDNWTNISNGALTGAGALSILEISKADSDFMVTGNAGTGKYFKTINGGTSWTEITTLTGYVLDILLHPTNVNILWAVNSAQGEVAKSTDGGATWTDISGSLPANVTSTIVYQEDSPNDALYVGQDLGIYYLDNTLGDWILFNSGLPNVIVRELEILACTGKIRAGTYGRGVWESDLYSFTPASACCPPAIPTISTTICNSNTMLTASVAPAGYTYQWYKDKVEIAGATNQNYTTTTSGSYFVVFVNGSCNSYHSDPTTLDLSLPSVPGSAMVGDAINMDGINDYISVPHTASIQLGNSFTIEFWAKTAAEFTGTKFLVRKEVAFGLDLVDGKDIRFVTWGDDILFSNAFLNDDQWHHYAFVANAGTDKKFYRDGALLLTDNNAFFTDQAATSLFLGFNNSPTNVSFDEFRIWNTARTIAQIQNNAYCSIDCKPAELVLYFPFEEGTANGDNTAITEIKDYSSYANNGTLFNFSKSGSVSNFVSGNKTGQIMGEEANCSSNNASMYQVLNIPDATAYSWTLPVGWSGTSTTNTIDITSNNTSGTISATATLVCGNPTFSKTIIDLGLPSVPGSAMVGDAINLDGINDYISVPHTTSIQLGNSFTIEFWAKSAAEFTGTKFLIRKEVAFGLDLVDGKDIRFVTWGDDILFSNAFLNDDQWHHYAFVANAGADKKFYRDGELLFTDNNAFYTDQGATSLFLGFDNSPTNVSFDEFRIWNTARTIAQIQNNAYCSIDCKPADLVLYFPFEEGTANGDNTAITEIKDYSSYANNGTLFNFSKNGSVSNFVSAGKTGSITGEQENCSNINTTYQVLNIPDASAYSWTLPSGWSGSSTTNSIVPTSNNTSGTIVATATLACGNPAFSKSINALGLCKGGLQFDGVDDYVNCGSGINLANTSFTIEFWGKLDATIGGSDFFFSKGTQSASNGLNIGFTSGSYFTFGFWGDDLNLNSSFTDNNWHHWACVFDEATDEQIIYKDGVLVGSRTTTNGNYTGAGDFHIGRATGGATADITIDELRIFNIVRSQAEIQAYMDYEIPVNTSGILAYYDFEEGTPESDNSALTQILDKAESGAKAGAHNGNLNGFLLNGPGSNFVFAKNGVGIALPVELVAFKGIVVADKIELNWETAQEINNNFFQIEKLDNPTNNKSTIIGKVTGGGSTNSPSYYSFIDDNPTKGENYYRLIQVDYDGAVEYSKIISVNYAKETLLVPKLFPNPVTQEMIIQNASGNAIIYNSFGEELMTISNIKTIEKVNTDFLSQGIYYIQIILENNKVVVIPFIK